MMDSHDGQGYATAEARIVLEVAAQGGAACRAVIRMEANDDSGDSRGGRQVCGSGSSNLSPSRGARYSCQEGTYPRLAAADRVGNPQKGGDGCHVAGVLNAYNGADKGIPKGGTVGGSTWETEHCTGDGNTEGKLGIKQSPVCCVCGNQHLGLGGAPAPGVLVNGRWHLAAHHCTQSRGAGIRSE